MKIYVLSVGAGILVGVIYALLNVRSPAPPIVALVGLLGILVGEQIPHVVLGWFGSQPALASWHQKIQPHVFGHLPGGKASPSTQDQLATSADTPEGRT